MSFFDKLKSGVEIAGNKAKVAVEVNRLKVQNHTKQKEIDQNMQKIGKQVFLSLTGRSVEFEENQIRPFIEKTLELEKEIESNQQEIKRLSAE
jgi:hemerythrin-like domain-containing protein